MILKLIIGFALALSAGLATADHDRSDQYASGYIVLAGNGNGISLDTAVSRARNRADGRVVSASTSKRNGKRIHKVRILTKGGHVRRFSIDARTGRFLR